MKITTDRNKQVDSIYSLHFFFNSQERFPTVGNTGYRSNSLSAHSPPRVGCGHGGGGDVDASFWASYSNEPARALWLFFSATNFSHQEITQARSPNE